MHQLELRADGVQVATRFVTTEECDAPMEYKQAYLDAKRRGYYYCEKPCGDAGTRNPQPFSAGGGERQTGDFTLLPVPGEMRIRLKYLTVSRRPLSTQ